MRRTNDVRVKLLSFGAAIVMMFVMFLCFSLTSLAAEGKVTADSAKIRKEASTSSEMVGGAVRGETYTITNEVTGADGMVWYQISYEEDKLGYIRSDLMQKEGSTTPATANPSTPASEVTELQPVNATVNVETVNVRPNASTSGNAVAQARRNTVVTITGQASDSEGKTWYRVNFTSDSGDVTGFIRYDFLTVSGEILPAETTPPTEENPPADNPPENDPATTTPAETQKYDVWDEDGVWYLVNYEEEQKYKIEDLFNAAKNNQKLYEETLDKVKSQKGWIIFLVFVVILLGVGVTLLFLKIKEVTDDAYFSAIEKETIRQRQAADSKNKKVMHTVGTNSKPGTAKQTVPVKTSVPKMNVPKTTDPTKQVTGSVPQTVKVSNPVDTKAVKPARPAIKSSTAAPKTENAQPRAASQPVSKPVPSKEVKKPASSSKQTKNFMVDDDDFEYEFLNWDGEEEK